MLNLDLLTEDMRDIAETLGEHVVVELMAKLKGVEVKVPLRWSQNNPLCRLDRKIADLIISTYPGDKFYIPNQFERVDNRALVAQLLKDGMSTIDIALKLELSERHVRNLAAGRKLPRKQKIDDRQIDLEDYLKTA